MALILEGVDGAGKSTLSEEFRKKGYEIIHRVYDPTYLSFFETYRDLLIGMDDRTILDRSFISEIIYGKVLRGISRLSNQEMIELLKVTANKQGKVLYCYASEDIIVRRLSIRSLAHKDVMQRLPELVAEYKTVLEIVAMYVPVVMIDTGQAPPQEILDSLMTGKIV